MRMPVMQKPNQEVLAMILMLCSMMMTSLQILGYAYQLSKCIQTLWMQPKKAYILKLDKLIGGDEPTRH